MRGEQLQAFRFLEGLARGFAPVLLELRPNEKRSLREWTWFESQHGAGGGSRLDLASVWLMNGSGVGFLPRNGLWVLDCDDGDAVERAKTFQCETGLFGPSVITPSGGRHFFFRMPTELQQANLKHHVCRPKDEDEKPVAWDFKIGTRTMLVGPGTLRDNQLYRPGSAWFDPPIVDPRWLHPGLELLREQRPFLVDRRDHSGRVRGACGYLNHAAISIQGKSGRGALRRVTSNLTVYFDLDPELAFHLLTHPSGNGWNDRCQPPWSATQLWRACLDSVNDVPFHGVKAHGKQEKHDRWSIPLVAFQEAMELARQPDEYILGMDLRAMFLDWAGLEPTECSASTFGKALRHAGWDRKLRTKGRLASAEGISLASLAQELASRGCEASLQNNNPLYLGVSGGEKAS